MHYRYGEYMGKPFPTPESRWPYGRVFDFILAYGEDAIDALNELGEDQTDLIEQLLQDGLLEKAAGRYRLTPRAVDQMQRRALMEIFANLPQTGGDGRPTSNAGAGAHRLEGTRPHQFGDPVSEIDMHQSLRNALADKAKASGSPLLPIECNENHLEMHLHEGTSSFALCTLIDMSGSPKKLRTKMPEAPEASMQTQCRLGASMRCADATCANRWFKTFATRRTRQQTQQTTSRAL
jgi:hypothetical protein